MLSDTLERVKKYWKDENLPIEEPLDRERLRDRLEALGVRATEEIVAVFSALNGFKEMDMDDELFSFWPMSWIIEENRKSEWVKDKSYVHFADFLIFSHRYAFRQSESPFVSVYCHYATDYIVKVAD